eukprot:3231351-Pleurochrysis_carterae.AAC.1
MAQNAGLTDRAEHASVDAVQMANIPIIDCSRAFAMLHDTFVGEPDGSDEHAPSSPAAALPQLVASGIDTSRAVRAG